MFPFTLRVTKACFCAVIVFVAALASGQNIAKPAVTGKSPILIVGSEQEYPPFSKGMTDDTAGGFTVELWNAVAREQRLDSKIRVLPFGKVLSNFRNGKIDVMINLAQSAERRKFAEFSAPYVVVKGAVFVRRTNSTIHQESDIRDKKVILLSKDLSQNYALGAYPGKEFITVQTAEDGFNKLAQGEGEAFLLSKVVGMVLLDQMGLKRQIEARADANFKQEFSFAVRKGNEELRQKINEGLVLVSESGEYDRIYNKWFGQFEIKPAGNGWITTAAFIALALTGALTVYIYLRYLVERRRQARQLRQTEAIFRAAFETAAVGMVQASLDGKYLRVNRSYCSFLGYAEVELLQKSFMDITYSEDLMADVELMDMLKVGEIDQFRLEKRYVRKDGKVVWGRIHVSLIPEVPGSPLTVLTAIEDVTQEVLNRFELSDSEARYRGLLEMAIDPTVVVSDEGIITELNWGAATRLNVQPEELLGKHISAIDEMLSSNHLSNAFRSAMAGEFVNRGGDQMFIHGEVLRFDVTASRIDLADSALVKISVHDSTERYQLTDQTKELAGRLDLVLEAGKIGCYTYNPNDNSIGIDRRLAQILGWGPESENRSFSARGLLRKLDVTDYRAMLETLIFLRDNLPNVITIEVVDGNNRNQTKTILIRSELFVSSENGKTVQMGACFDITDQVNSAQEIKKINIALNEANSGKDRLIAKWSHELRTPLHVILGFGQILEGRLMDTQNREMVKKMSTSGEHLLGLINDMLLLADTSAQPTASKEEVVNLAIEATQTCALLQPMADSRVVHLELDTGGEDANAIIMKGNRRSVRQILLNIVDNAIKYNRKGGSVMVRCGVVDPNEVTVTVTDTGIGMDSCDINRLFVPFYRGWSESSAVQGTGLGLTITRDMVEAMGGRISVKSELGVGASFTVTFPRVLAEEPILTEIIADKDLPISGRKVKLAFLNCNGSGSLEVGATEEQVNDTMKMRDSVLKATAQGGRLSYAECQLASDLVATRELNADAFVLMVFCADDLHWLQDLRKSAITRKRPCFILLPESLSPTVRESIVSEAISNGAECVLFWTNVRQLVRNIEFIIGELRLP